MVTNNMVNMFVDLTVGTIPHHMADHYIVRLKYIHFLLTNYTKMEKCK